MRIEDIYGWFADSNYTICTDTRNVIFESLFVALKGEKFDANFFIDEALQKGCKYAIGEYYNGDKKNVFLVPDTLLTLQQLAKYHRKKMKATIIAVAGSNGKTTTKELASAVLCKKYKITYTKGNFNNHIGVPLTLLQIKPETEISIIEMGANHTNELELLCDIADPDYGIVTNIGKEHLGGFGSMEAIIETETYLYKYLQKKAGKAFVNADDEILMERINSVENITYGKNSNYDVTLIDVESSPFLNVKFSLKNSNEIYSIKSNLVGKYNAQNILSAVSIGYYFQVPVNDIISAIESYIPTNHRSQLMKIGSNIVVMDAYNANPSSMLLSLESFFELNLPNKVLILGDMLELGEFEDEEHKAILAFIQKIPDINKIYLVGKVFARVKPTTFNAKVFQNVDELCNDLYSNPINQSSVFVKGSHGIHLEKILDILKNE